MKVIELFGGIGATKRALLNLGLEHKQIDYVEIDEKAVRSWNSMFLDSLKYKPQSVVGWNLNIDVMVHGSPCQDFSRAGTRLGGNGEDKTRSSLMWETLKIINNLGDMKPKVVIWENVKGVLDKDMIETFKKYLNSMNELGYKNNYKVLNAIDFGVPQKRERVFVVSVLSDNYFDFESLKTREFKHINNFLEKNVSDLYTITSPSMTSKINCKNTRSLKIIEDHCLTITTKQNRCPNSGIVKIGDSKYRLLTERECWRLMGFKDEDFEAALKVHPGKKGCQNGTLYKQAGNSIAVPILEEIFLSLKEQKFI